MSCTLALGNQSYNIFLLTLQLPPRDLSPHAVTRSLLHVASLLFSYACLHNEDTCKSVLSLAFCFAVPRSALETTKPQRPHTNIHPRPVQVHLQHLCLHIVESCPPEKKCVWCCLSCLKTGVMFHPLVPPQVCYSARGHDNPMYWKSYQLNRLLGHMRHPSFLALSAILWGRPSMPLDRALLAISFTLYPLAYFDVDAEDHRYVCSWFKSKHRLLLAKDSQRKA